MALPLTCTLAINSATPTLCSNNLYDLNVNVSYSNPPTGNISINVGGTNYTFTPNGSGSETFTITGLNADGMMKTVTAMFSADPTCDASETYTAPESCTTTGTCNCKEYIYINEPTTGVVHKLEVQAGIPLNEVTGVNGGTTWYPGTGTSVLPRPHGLASDLNGNLYIGASDFINNPIRKFSCDGAIEPISPTTITYAQDMYNMFSIDNFIFKTTGTGLVAYNSCTGQNVGSLCVLNENGTTFSTSGSNNWGLHYNETLERGYMTSRSGNYGRVWVFTKAQLMAAASGQTIACVPILISPGALEIPVVGSKLMPYLDDNPDGTTVRTNTMGITTDNSGNIYVVVGGIGRAAPNSYIYKYNAAGEFIMRSSAFGQIGVAAVYSKMTNRLYVNIGTASSAFDCISVFDPATLNYLGTAYPNPPSGGATITTKAMAILTECCPINLPSTFQREVCGAVGNKFYLNQEAFSDCDGVVCGSSWTPVGTLNNMTFDACDNSVVVTGTGCGTFTLDIGAVSSTGCLARSSTFTICNTVIGATVSSVVGTCTGSIPNNNASINITSVSNGNQAGVSTGATYTGPSYGAVGTIDVSSGSGSFPNLMHNTQYTVRIFNGSNDCYFDYVVTTPSVTCCDLTVQCTPQPQTNCSPINGSASVVASNAVGTVTYLWSSGETTSSISNKAAGTNTVTVTDGGVAGCSATCQAVILSTVAIPTAMCDPMPNTNCATPNGSVTVTTNGNQILWSTGGTTATINGLSAGTYTVTVTNTATGCTNTCSAMVANATVNPTCTITANTQPSCANLTGGSITVNPSPAGTYTYSWSDSGPATASRTGLTGGTYTVTVTNTTTNCTGVCNITLETPMNCCNINAIVPQNLECLDNGTPAKITDNRIRFSAMVTNTNTSLTGYNVTINGGTTITPNTNVPYGLTQFTLGAGTAGGGATFTVTVTDITTSGCTQTFQVTDPGTCNNSNPNDCLTPKCGTATIQVNGN